MPIKWRDVLRSDAEYVIVESYGYVEKGAISQHFEPFRRLRKFKFEIVRDPNPEYAYLTHPWLRLEENENDLEFRRDEDGTFVLFDPDLIGNPY